MALNVTGTLLKSPVTHETLPPPFVAKKRRVRKRESVEKLVKKKSFSRNAKKSSD